jgi:hypothetical protein
VRRACPLSIHVTAAKIHHLHQNSSDIIEFFWPVISGLIPKAVKDPARSLDVLLLSHSLLVKLFSLHSTAVDLPELAKDCSQLLLLHETSEVMFQAFLIPQSPLLTVDRKLATPIARMLSRVG